MGLEPWIKEGLVGDRTVPFDGLLPRGGSIWVADAAGNDLFRIDQATGALHLVTVFPNRLQTQEAVPIKVFQGPGDRLYVTLFFCVNAASEAALGGVAEVRPDGNFRMVSFNRLPISGAVGPTVSSTCSSTPTSTRPTLAASCAPGPRNTTISTAVWPATAKC
ncbi:MAG TPA: hypothetical protein VHC97_28130 [Thermoanaerobaculia bacterium]|jgi:hypothetical protein|nr:hypothetical protein [Thermoanaerobaculia bacterium]